MAKVSTLTDDYATADSAKWDGYNGTTIAVASGQLSITPDATFTRELISHVTYDASGSSALIKVASLGSCQILSLNLHMSGSTDRLDIQYDNGVMRLRELASGVYSDTTVTYSAIDHIWWRIRESGSGTVFWETSPTGAAGSWTVLRSKAWAVSQITAMYASIIAYTTSGTTPALLDSFNLPPAAPAGTGSWWCAASHTGGPQSAPTTGGGGGPSDPDGGPYTTAFYVSPSGNDTNVGTDPAAPWLTINRAMQNNYTAGQALLFERGGTYQVNQINKTPTAAGGARWTIGAYGTGAQPILSHYKICNNAASWTLYQTGIWRIQLGNPATHTGMTEVPAGVAFGNESSTNIGHISVDGVIYGWKRTSIAGCVNQWDFYGDTTGDYLYVRSSANPKSLCTDLRVAPDGRIIMAHNNMEIRNIEFQGCGGVTFSGAGSNASNMKILYNTIRNIGGSYLIGYGNPPYQTRWGDGVEIWGGSSNYEVAYNTIIGSFDAAIIGGQGSGTLNNIQMHHNNIQLSGMALEMSIKNGNWDNMVFENNTVTDTGLDVPGNWASKTQPNQTRNSCLIFMDVDAAHGTSTNIFVRNNTFDRAVRYLFAAASSPFVVYDPPLPAGVVFTGNTINMASGSEIQLGRETINNAATYQSRTGREAGSTFTVL